MSPFYQSNRQHTGCVAAGAFVSNSCVCALFILFYLSLLPCVRAVEREEKGEHRERVFPVETNTREKGLAASTLGFRCWHQRRRHG
jgi:hypothetical protein